MKDTSKIDKRGKLEEEVFSYKTTKDKKVLIYWNTRQVTTLSGEKAFKFMDEVEELDEYGEQILMARVTGQFKYGNERVQKNSKKNKYREAID